MTVSTLTLALSTLNDLGIHVTKVGKDNPTVYALSYEVEGTQRIMLVPRKTTQPDLLQYEVGVLATRSVEAQLRVGQYDAAN